MANGFGAKRPASSMLPVFCRKYEQFSQMQPPCIAVETITAGKETVTRGSMPARSMVCVPPPLAPVTAIREESISGKESRKSRARTEFQVCNPMIDCK